MSKRTIIVFIFMLLGMVGASSSQASDPKKVLFIDSYHAGYPWSDSVTSGILKKFNISMDQQGSLFLKNSTIDLKIVRMDTKRNGSEASKKQAALNAKTLIESWKPDVVIASDDNASKYLIMPYFKDKKVPFVFCGVNWDASVYGYPYSNVTGMEEVTLAPQTLKKLQEYAKGDRVGIIAADVFSEHKTVANIKKKFGMKFHKEYFCRTFDQWKQNFQQLQSEVDMILFPNFTGISDWDDVAAKDFVAKHINVPVGTMDSWVTHYAVIGLTKTGEEQGEWAAQTAFRILNGESPGDIPIVTNKQAKIYLNMRLAKKLGIVFPMELISVATFVE